MPETSATVHITKLAAAQRQLRAAVRMFFSREDELAVHTVASAAYRTLADLKASRGRDEVGDYYLTAIFYCVRDFRRGTLPGYLSNDPDMMAWIRDLAEQLPIQADSKFEDIAASVSSEAARKFWQKRNAAANFLKHADRDPQGNIPLDDIDNLTLLMQAYGAYVDLVRDQLEAEGLVLWLYFSVSMGMREGLPSQWQGIAQKLEQLDVDKRLALCASLVRELSK